jgi:predicted metal-dependent hydrolase
LRRAVRHGAGRLRLRVSQIQVRPMRTKWASMSTKGWLLLSTDVLGLPQDLAEYVIIHELAHLLVPNHGKVFKLFLHAYVPDWEERESRLKALGMTL